MSGIKTKRFKMSGIKYKDCECCLEYSNVKDDLIQCKYLCCNRNYQSKFHGNLIRRYTNTYKSFNQDISKIFILLLQKGVYQYECMNGWEAFNKKSLLEKEDFYRPLNMEDITYAD